MNQFAIRERVNRMNNGRQVMQQEAEITSMTVTTNEIVNIADKSSRKRKLYIQYSIFVLNSIQTKKYCQIGYVIGGNTHHQY